MTPFHACFGHFPRVVGYPHLIGMIALLVLPLTGTSQETAGFLQPFELVADPMARLVLINFEKDPDSLYIGFEPQVFDDPHNGNGHLVICWRVDGRVDVYFDPALRTPDSTRYDIAGTGLAHLLPTRFDEARCEIGERGVDLAYSFTDLHGRQIRLRIREDHPARRKPFGLLAPMGDAVLYPTSMPLVLLHDFYFVRRRHTETEVNIDGRPHRLDRLPMRMDRRKMFFTRYSPDPLILTFNPSRDMILGPVSIGPGIPHMVGTDSLLLYPDPSGRGLKALERRQGRHSVNLEFVPPFPDIAQAPEGFHLEGRFTLRGDPSVGELAGTFLVDKHSQGIDLRLHPAEGWKPRPDKFSLRLMYGMARVFRQWPATYQWTARLEPRDDGDWHMRSQWTRLR